MRSLSGYLVPEDQTWNHIYTNNMKQTQHVCFIFLNRHMIIYVAVIIKEVCEFEKGV